MKDKETDNRPDMETDRYQIVAWKISAEELEKIKEETLFIYPGEKVHKAVILEFDDGNTAKVLSKIRDSDSRINILIKTRRPTGQETIMKSDKWVIEKDYDKLVAVIRKDNGVHEVLNTGGEQMHRDIVYATDFMKAKEASGTPDTKSV